MPAPTGFVAALTGTGGTGFPIVATRWEASTGARPDTYRVYQSTALATYFLAGEVDGGRQFFHVNWLLSSTSYRFYVVAVYSGVESAASTVQTVVTEACTLTAPNVTAVGPTSTQTTVAIVFSSAPEELAVFRSTGGGPWEYRESLYYRDTFYDEGLTPATTYTYRYVIPTVSPPSDITITTIARPVGYPLEPEAFGLSIEHSSINLFWENPGDHAVEIYRAYHAPSAEGAGTFSLLATTSAGATSYSDTTFDRKKMVYYKIRTSSGSNKSDYVTNTANIEGLPEQKCFSTPSAPRLGITTNIGYGQTSTVPTEPILAALGPSEVLAIHWNTTPLAWKINFNPCGTETHPIIIRGIANGNGDYPIIDGRNAQEYGGSSASQTVGLFTLGPVTGDTIGYKPNHVIFENLNFQYCRPEDAFLAFGTGTSTNYSGLASGIRVKTALNYTVRNCTFDYCPQGVSSGGGGYDRQFAGSGTIEDCTFDNFGSDVGGNVDGRHAIYIDGPQNTIKNNTIRGNATGFGGMGIKNRGPDPLLEGNIFTENLPKLFDLIESYPCSLAPHIRRMPNYGRERIRGNRLFIPSGGMYRMCRLVYDEYAWAAVGPGAIEVSSNTVVSQSSTGSSSAIRLFRTEGGGESGIIQYGNAFVSYADSGTPRDLIVVEGTAVVQHGKSFWSYDPTDADGDAMVVGRSKVTSGVPSPGFVDLQGGNWRPAIGSPLIGTYEIGPSDATESAYEPGGEARTTVPIEDLGAYEYDHDDTPDPPEPDTAIPGFFWPPTQWLIGTVVAPTPIPATPTIPSPALVRDGGIFADIKARLIATGQFSLVRRAEEAGQGPLPADEPFIATIQRGRTRDEWIDSDTIQHTRQYMIKIECRDVDPTDRGDTLDRLANAVRNALNEKSLASTTFPHLTLIEGDEAARPGQPNEMLTIRGTFGYLITDPNSYYDA